MENNENDVQNQVNEVKTEVKKEKKKSSGSGVKGLVIAVLLILFLGIGLGGGVLLSTGKWNPFVKNSTETKTEYAKFLETINEENFRTIQMDKLKDNYDYDSYKITDYNVAKSIVEVIKKYKLEEVKYKSLPNMNFIMIEYNNTYIGIHYNEITNEFLLNKGDGDQYWVSNDNDLSDLKKIIEENIVLDKNKISYFEKNADLEYTSNPKDDINGKVAIIKMGEKQFQTTMRDGYYEYKDMWENIYYIKEIINIHSEYRATGNDNWANLFEGVIEYIDKDGIKRSFDTAIIIPTDNNKAYIQGPYINYTGTTRYVKGFTNLYDDFGETETTKYLYKFGGQFYENQDYDNTTANIKEYCELSFDNIGTPGLKIGTKSNETTEYFFQTKDVDVEKVKYEAVPGGTNAKFEFKAMTPSGEGTGSAVLTYDNNSENDMITVSAYIKYSDGTVSEFNAITVKKVLENYNGKFKRIDATGRSTGNLVITDFTNHSFKFELDASHINGEDIEKSKQEGRINFGNVSGFANRIAEDVYQFIPDKDDELIKNFEGGYKINFYLRDKHQVEIKEIYDDSKYNQGPYSGGNVRFNGMYLIKE